MSKKHDTITVGQRIFSSLADLADHAAEALRIRASGLEADDIEAILAADERGNGSVSPKVHEAAAKLRFHGPSREPAPPTAFDSKLERARAELQPFTEAAQRAKDDLHAARLERRRLIHAAGRGPGTPAERAVFIAEAQGQGAALVQEAEWVEQRADMDWVRANARVRALEIAQARSREAQTLRFHNPDGGPGLTLAQMRKRRANEPNEQPR